MEENRKGRLEQDDSTGQEQEYGSQENMSNLNRDADDTFINLDEKEDEPEIYLQEDEDEVNIPEKERNTTPPYAGNSSEQKHGYEPNGDTNEV
ncbi:MAG: hypothetical protein GZ091_17955 [Paludibacter sp.]|nr:hypothetical protein [Paludibacter sp.]